MPPAHDWRRRALIGAGGAVGAVVRWAILVAEPAGRFPWPVLAINVAGSLALGIALAEQWRHPTHRLLLHDFVGIGFCGGLTTFSTFAVEVANLLRHHDAGLAVSYSIVSVCAAIAAVVVGAALGRRVLALTLPVEGEP